MGVLFESILLFSLAVLIILVGLLVYYFKKRIVEIEQKNTKCLEIVQDVYMQQMQNIQTIMNIERSHKEELEQLAIDASLDEIQMPDDWFEINANLGPFESPEFKMGKPGESFSWCLIKINSMNVRITVQ